MSEGVGALSTFKILVFPVVVASALCESSTLSESPAQYPLLSGSELDAIKAQSRTHGESGDAHVISTAPNALSGKIPDYAGIMLQCKNCRLC